MVYNFGENDEDFNFYPEKKDIEQALKSLIQDDIIYKYKQKNKLKSLDMTKEIKTNIVDCVVEFITKDLDIFNELCDIYDSQLHDHFLSDAHENWAENQNNTNDLSYYGLKNSDFI